MNTKIYYLRVCATASKKKEWKYMPVGWLDVFTASKIAAK